jgi:hypothetical protein
MLRDRSLVLVAGSGRSGTSLVSGILQRLGYYVPAPEGPADDTNPRGFAESQWVVDFHTRLLKRARVQVSDARPAAWARTADVCLDDGVEGQLRTWLASQFGDVDHILIKDPRLSWFLPLWRRCAEEIGVSPRFVTMLRHPAAVIESKRKWYGPWQGDVSRTAGWINQTLFTERATREALRVFVRYDDLLDDWTRAVGAVGEALDLAIIRDAPASSMRSIHDFVDRSLSRSSGSWDESGIPAPLRTQADDVWALVYRLAEDDVDGEAVIGELEAARAAYLVFYEEAEAIVQSSIQAASRQGRHAGDGLAPTSTLQRIARVVPKRYRRRVPLRWRATVVRAFRDCEAAIAPVFDAADIVADPHYEARGSITEVMHPVLGSLKMQGQLFRLGSSSLPAAVSGPELGAHNRDVLVDELGLAPAELAHLEDLGVVRPGSGSARVGARRGTGAPVGDVSGRCGPGSQATEPQPGSVAETASNRDMDGAYDNNC